MYTMGNVKIEKVVFKIHSTILRVYINIKEKKIKISKWQMCKFNLHENTILFEKTNNTFWGKNSITYVNQYWQTHKKYNKARIAKEDYYNIQ
jgi:hypothetical protein